MTSLKVQLGNYPHTRPLKERTIPVDGVDCHFTESSPLHAAFARMVRNLEYDVCEMPVATYLQAREAGVPVRLLPVVMVGSGHHRSLTRLPDGPGLSPRDLPGRRVAVRAYSQTTGLWVRGILREDFGVDASDVTWMTTEEPHVAQYRNPPNVRLCAAERVVDLLRAGDADAAVLGPRAIGGQGAGLVPIVPDAEEAERAWEKRHGAVPVNHLVVASDDAVRSAPDAVAALYRALAEAIAATAGERDGSPGGRAVAAGWTEPLLRCLDVAGRYALEQQVVRSPVDIGAIERESGFLDR
ncbi:hypothetical protein E1293_13005 [Actinomadura darangshiensis]|uniref:ABC transporter substrate-binding protein n=1 Tax=Actinomadura darangshiensis TaxID=705336 RepID=A0A4R5BDS7_9ACTN|nr:hypothetical protein [Actinomadura darangshiensis]TDD84381.1 hypothetical protein E1293_13005 [Actinomadura darangshiensis]